jgi:hypothetical protein
MTGDKDASLSKMDTVLVLTGFMVHGIKCSVKKGCYNSMNKSVSNFPTELVEKLGSSHVRSTHLPAILVLFVAALPCSCLHIWRQPCLQAG